LLIEFNTSNDADKTFHVAFGVIGQYLMSARTKQVLEQNRYEFTKKRKDFFSRKIRTFFTRQMLLKLLPVCCLYFAVILQTLTKRINWKTIVITESVA